LLLRLYLEAADDDQHSSSQNIDICYSLCFQYTAPFFLLLPLLPQHHTVDSKPSSTTVFLDHLLQHFLFQRKQLPLVSLRSKRGKDHSSNLTTINKSATAAMKFSSTAVAACLFAAVLSATTQQQEVAAFSPKNFVPHKSGLMVPSSSSSGPGGNVESSTGSNQVSSPLLWRPPKQVMKMVAGGAERAYGQEYYEGTFNTATPLESFSMESLVCV
jgi:hypothetical protein